MFNIFLCEDSELERKKLTKYVQDYVKKRKEDMVFSLSTDSPKEILKQSQLNANRKNIYFLDVEIKNSNINGIHLASEIRKYDPNCYIIFITSHVELSYLTFIYKVEALDYIIKDNFDNIQKRLIECLDTVLSRESTLKNTNPNNFFTVETNNKSLSFQIDEILYFETSQSIHKVILHTNNKIIEFYGKLKEIVQLNNNFYRCHQSYVVNITNIKKVNTKDMIIIMNNNEQCYVSRRLLKGLKNHISQLNCEII
ncbi:LytTR family DNA-binding domain-containing protein [Priestia megaterium]|uniref:LytR/AlgR family response regulator transcription factor n=1 Tax=Priestia megaterium TaxID=1404 RepID=UPI0030129D96